MNTRARDTLNAIAAERIIILDGAMGSLIQSFHLTEAEFRGDLLTRRPVEVLGCNDLLCLTKPEVISHIHEAYLEAGADITKTCSFSATPISLADFGIADLSYEISAAAARLARRAADTFSTPDKPRFVAGSISPTSKSGSISPDMDDPGKRAVTWDELVAAFDVNVRGLLDGGADILLLETIFDTLNAKAAIFAINRILEERQIDVPVMLSATVANAVGGGRILSGQTIEAFCVSVSQAKPWSLGLNCSFGADTLKAHVANLGAFAAGSLISAHPNAGLPNQLGGYDEGPKAMAAKLELYFKEGLVNIAGGCCGSTPAHIAAIAEAAKHYPPRKVSVTFLPEKVTDTFLRPDELDAGTCSPVRTLFLAGLEHLTIGSGRGLVDIGERTNVAGSRKFLRLIKDGNYGEALGVAREMIAAGAVIIDVCMDDALLDAEEAMTRFLNLALSDPEIARVPIMIDSSRWNVIEAGLKCVQGKCLVNSISLKEGPEEFLRRAKIARSYGAAVVVMLFDEQGQAANYDRKIEVARRSWDLLRGADFPAQDIVFDPNVLSVASGLAEHDAYALDFIHACAWIHENCPGPQISGGISNLSFAFRGNDTVREAMHAVFLKHAIDAGLTMAIVNPASLISCDEIDEDLRRVAEDVILNTTDIGAAASGKPSTPAERLLALAEKTAATGANPASIAPVDAWRSRDAEERIVHAMVKGIDDYIGADVLELRGRYSRSLDIVEGPLMRGMREVGERFGAGKMFLPQVIRSARVMKKAVAVLEPFMEQEKALSAANSTPGAAIPGAATILLATVKGDVHDIGKNIVGVVLGCNGYTIKDLGVMVPTEVIVDAAQLEHAAVVGVSGLITPSLDEMVRIAREMEKRGLSIPLLVGGATTSLAHTALRIAPEYSGPVVHVQDAGQCPAVLRSLLSDSERPRFLEQLETRYREARARHDSIHSHITIIPLAEARANRVPASGALPWAQPLSSPQRLIELNDYPLEKLIPRIDWEGFLQSWELGSAGAGAGADGPEGSVAEAREKLLDDARAMLQRACTEKLLTTRGVVGLYPARAQGDDVVLFADAAGGGEAGGVPAGGQSPGAELARFAFLRSQDRKRKGAYNPCLADFVAGGAAQAAAGAAGQGAAGQGAAGPTDSGWVGLFALSAGFGLDEAAAAYRKRGDDYGALLLATLANSLAEAFSEEAHRLVAGGAAEGSVDGAFGIRPAFGYPTCPDHQDKAIAFRLLEARQRCGLHLTESMMIQPSASVCGMYLPCPGSFYFSIAAVGEDQIADWARRKGIGIDEARQRIATMLPLVKKS